MGDKMPDICPYYVGTVLGRHRSAVLCYDWGLESKLPPYSGARVSFDNGAVHDELTMCRENYTLCSNYKAIRDRQGKSHPWQTDGAMIIRNVIDVMALDVLRDMLDDLPDNQSDR